MVALAGVTFTCKKGSVMPPTSCSGAKPLMSRLRRILHSMGTCRLYCSIVLGSISQISSMRVVPDSSTPWCRSLSKPAALSAKVSIASGTFLNTLQKFATHLRRHYSVCAHLDSTETCLSDRVNYKTSGLKDADMTVHSTLMQQSHIRSDMMSDFCKQHRI